MDKEVARLRVGGWIVRIGKSIGSNVPIFADFSKLRKTAQNLLKIFIIIDRNHIDESNFSIWKEVSTVLPFMKIPGPNGTQYGSNSPIN